MDPKVSREVGKAFHRLGEAKKKVHDVMLRESRGSGKPGQDPHVDELGDAFAEEMKAFVDYYTKSRKQWGYTRKEIDNRLKEYYGLLDSSK